MLDGVQNRDIPLILLIGLPGSGKSTYATNLLRSGNRCVISTDAIRAALFGDAAIQGEWRLIWQEVGRQCRQTVQQIAVGELELAIYDATNVVRKQRRQAIAHARGCGFTHIWGVWLNPPLECCLARNQQRDRRVPEPVILRMQRRLVAAPPNLTEGLDALLILGAELMLQMTEITPLKCAISEECG
jgi:predicted kinase